MISSTALRTTSLLSAILVFASPISALPVVPRFYTNGDPDHPELTNQAIIGITVAIVVVVAAIIAYAIIRRRRTQRLLKQHHSWPTDYAMRQSGGYVIYAPGGQPQPPPPIRAPNSEQLPVYRP